MERRRIPCLCLFSVGAFRVAFFLLFFLFFFFKRARGRTISPISQASPHLKKYELGGSNAGAFTAPPRQYTPTIWVGRRPRSGTSVPGIRTFLFVTFLEVPGKQSIVVCLATDARPLYLLFFFFLRFVRGTLSTCSASVWSCLVAYRSLAERFLARENKRGPFLAFGSDSFLARVIPFWRQTSVRALAYFLLRYRSVARQLTCL